MRNLFKVNEVPFKELDEFGISKESFLDLPKDVLDKVLTGKPSPLLKFTVKNDKGELFTIPAKISLQRGEDSGVAELLIHPVRKEIDNSFGFSSKELKALKEKETVVKTIDRGKGKEKCWCQLDKETNCIITARYNDVRIPETIGNVTLGGEQKQRIKEGKPVEITAGDTKVTVGVDLNDQTGFKIVDGDLNEWYQKKLVEWDRITPGATGFWQTSENGWEYKKFQKEDIHQENNREVKKVEEYSTGMNTGMKIGRRM